MCVQTLLLFDVNLFVIDGSVTHMFRCNEATCFVPFGVEQSHKDRAPTSV